MAADTFFGGSITFDSGFFAEILSVRWVGMSRDSIDTSHAGLTAFANSRAFMTKIPSDLMDPGRLEVDFQFEPDTAPPIDSDAETVTVTFPLESGQNSAATWACSGFMTNIDVDSGGHGEDKMTATGTIEFTGDPTFTAAT